ncbi:PTS sugar transporter subunit IIA [Roseiconus nitratireducens]|uniref:PTS sugar transporter subunit IIA n=1 Tax=Roseiconus nitratireducens TaxID=2605748 RepID=A0A5M6D4V1_9BACT|nr:PTS sugar transporter subunit IIA [Roseiconus nitratireducens]KAA5541796.1 PTS sugar transporter subunit IIA [Roseiconus nitratireducens]
METVQSSDIRLTDVFPPSCFFELGDLAEPRAVFTALLAGLARQGHISTSDARDFVEILCAREQLGPSAIGKGFAFPHLRSHRVPRLMGAVGVLKGCDWGALDGQPTRCVFLMLSPISRRREHGRLLEKLFSLMRDCTLALVIERPGGVRMIEKHLRDLDANG